MSVVTTETDADYFPGNTGAYNTILAFPIRPGCSDLSFELTNNGSLNCAGRYHLDAGSPTTYLTSGFNDAAGHVDTRIFTATSSGPLTDWAACTVELGGNAGFTGLVHLKVLQTWSGSAGSFCVYGTQLQPGGTFTQYLTPGLIDIALGALGLAWLAPVFTALWFTYINAQDLCSVGPPAMPPITLQTLTQASPSQIWDALRAVMWPYFCQCAPAPLGGTPPTDYPVPAPAQPINWPGAAPSFDCDDTSLCTLVSQLMRSVAAMQQVVQLDYRNDVLVQRQAVPFGYVHGLVHAGLAGSGDFAIADILGLEVNFTTLPPVTGHSASDPDTYHQIGKVSLGTGDGWRRSWMPTHNPYLIFPISGAFTRAGYTFPPGAVVTITELVREP